MVQNIKTKGKSINISRMWAAMRKIEAGTQQFQYIHAQGNNHSSADKFPIMPVY